MRIISGKFRGRRLECPKLVTRPTLDRVREALFSILGDVSGLCVVDLYAGSGALGLEALSRGARHVTLVEADRGAAQVIRKNVAGWGVETQLRVLESSVERARPMLRSGRMDSTIDGASVVKSEMSLRYSAGAKAFIASQLPPNATSRIASGALRVRCAAQMRRMTPVPYRSLR